MDNQCADWDAMITICNDKESGSPEEWKDIAWDEVNIDRDHYINDYG